MLKLGFVIGAAAALLAVTAVAHAQGISAKNIAARPKILMVFQPAVRKEISLSAEQDKKIKAIFGETIQDAGDGRVRMQLTQDDNLDKMFVDAEAVLKPEQKARLTELWIQREGGFALTNEDIQKRLGLSKSQVEKVESILEEYAQEFQELIASSGGQVGPAQMDPLRNKTKSKLTSVLSKEQSEKLEAMKGKIFEFPKAKPPVHL